NVMIVDLMRNDLSHICQRGSVTVEELFGIYSFPQVHQMISTVVGTIDESINWADVLQATFPMGSMTGAPKEKVLALTEQYEATARGLYSGTIFYQEPNGNFDANVVIRTILYNEATSFLSFHVGGGITANSDPHDEYAECLVKATAILQALNAVIEG
ncbi:MAG: chorismate-binding protein, partial [Chitinophagaceae bacterium]